MSSTPRRHLPGDEQSANLTSPRFPRYPSALVVIDEYSRDIILVAITFSPPTDGGAAAAGAIVRRPPPPPLPTRMVVDDGSHDSPSPIPLDLARFARSRRRAS